MFGALGEGQKVSPIGTDASDGAGSDAGQSLGDIELVPELADGAVEIQLTEEQQGQV